MDKKPETVVIVHSPNDDTEDLPENNSILHSGILVIGWIFLSVLCVYSMIVVSAFIEQVYNPEFEEYYRIDHIPDNGLSDPHIQLEFHHQNSEIIDDVEYEIYEIKLEDDNYYSRSLVISLTDPYPKDDEFDLRLSNTAISRSDSFSFWVQYSTTNGSGGASFSCSNFADCDEDGDGWLYDYERGSEVYFCNCGTFYDNAIMIALPEGSEPTRMGVDLEYDRDESLKLVIFRTVFVIGLTAVAVFGWKTEKKLFTRTTMSLGVLLTLLGPSIFVHL